MRRVQMARQHAVMVNGGDRWSYSVCITKSVLRKHLKSHHTQRQVSAAERIFNRAGNINLKN
jgi:hypothetical protein